MRKWRIAVAGVALVVSSITTVASAQYSRDNRGPNDENEFQRGQFRQNVPSVNRSGQAQQFRSNRGTNERYYARRVSTQSRGDSLTDQQIASWLLVDNRGEIQLARLAEEKATCDEVKEFAEHLIDDHAQMVEDLQQVAGRSRTNRQQMPGLNIVRLKQQLGQQCVASAEEDLNQKDGDEFDKCFVGLQIAKHMEMLDTLKVFSRYASPELDELIEDAEQKTEEHLEHAKELIKQLEADSDSSSSRSSSRGSSTRENRRNRSSDD